MGCCGKREKQVKEIHKWHYINLSDFRSGNCITLFSYMSVWILADISVAVYCVDTFTAFRLLAFNQWSSQVEMQLVSFVVVKWVFSGCIIFSWVLCFYEWYVAVGVMAKETVTEDYLDPLAVVLQSIRIPGGWRRFLVFAELTKSKKKAAWFAIFVYFQRKSALRILAAEGPRQALNAITIYSVARSKLLTSDGNDDDSLVIAFFKNIAALAVTDRNYAIVLYAMCFTLLIWIFSMIALSLALFFYLFFVWHHVRPESLSDYCRRKVETRLARIVKAKTDKVWAKQEKEIKRAQEKALKTGKPLPVEEEDPFEAMKRQPTLPMFDEERGRDDKLPRHPSISTISTVPPYSSQPQTPGDYPSRDYPPRLPRHYTNESMGGSTLLGDAAPMGQSGPYGAPYSRPATSNSSRSFAHQPNLPSLSTGMPSYPASIRPSPMSASERRVTPPSSTPWRDTPSEDSNGSEDGYELQESSGLGLPAALKIGGPVGPRRDVSSPGPQGRGPMPFAQPQRSFTAPLESQGAHGRNSPSESWRSMTPSGPPPTYPVAAPSGRMTPGGPSGHGYSASRGGVDRGMAPSRGMTPNGLSRPGGFGHASERSFSGSVGGPALRAHTPGASVSSRKETTNSKDGGWGTGPPGMAF